MAFEVTEASRAEQPQAQLLLDHMPERHPEFLQRCSRLSADKGYDDHKLISRLWDQHQIRTNAKLRIKDFELNRFAVGVASAVSSRGAPSHTQPLHGV